MDDMDLDFQQLMDEPLPEVVEQVLEQFEDAVVKKTLADYNDHAVTTGGEDPEALYEDASEAMRQMLLVLIRLARKHSQVHKAVRVLTSAPAGKGTLAHVEQIMDAVNEFLGSMDDASHRPSAFDIY